MKYVDRYRTRRFIEDLYDEYGLCVNSVFLLFLLISTWVIASMITGDYDRNYFISYTFKACKYSFITSLFITK